MKMSKSRLLIYLQCPERFRLQYILKLATEEPKEGSPLVKGSELHQVFEDYYKIKEAREVKTEEDIFNLLIQHPLATKEDKELQEEYHSHLSNFAAYNYNELVEKGPEGYIPIGRELDLYDEKTRLRGIIDRVEVGENGYKILDYKTGRPGTLKKYTLELALYKVLYENVTGNKVDKVGIYFSKNGKLRVTDITSQDCERALGIMEGVRKKIKNKEFPQNPGFLCGWCSFESICRTNQYY